VAPPPIGTLAWPLPGAVVTQGFGPSPYSIEPSYGGYAHFHTGLDLQGPPGSLVLAADGGLVASVTLSTRSGTKAGYGSYVVINHGGGLTTLYAHLAVVFVHKGQIVRRGQVIGRQGNTGNSTGPHLHFEVRVNGTPVDPARCFPPVTNSSRPAAGRRA
jgi:murein DD-endopeptidase MepM/ murein hydrolase activator NlpD